MLLNQRVDKVFLTPLDIQTSKHYKYAGVHDSALNLL